jgi:aryl-alcohol dehydrogenase-like predicted oxidoreductase
MAHYESIPCIDQERSYEVKYKILGRTGLSVSEIGFGCGPTAALFTDKPEDEQVRATRTAIEGGINFFDTAFWYGMGSSESHLGETLRRLGNPDVLVASKLRFLRADLRGEDLVKIAKENITSSLARLGRDHLDLYQIHNSVSRQSPPENDFETPRGGALSVHDVLERGVVEALEQLKREGLCRYIGFSGLGDPYAVHQLVASGRFDAVQVYYNLLNPSAGVRVPAGYRYIDYGCVIPEARERDIGIIGIRALAGGALCDVSDFRAPGVGSWAVGARAALEADYVRARELLGFRRVGESLSEAAVRFVVATVGISTALVGFNNVADVQSALRVAGRPADVSESERDLLVSTLRTE